MHNSDGSLVKSKATEIFRSNAMLFYVLQKLP
jgi:hypothetical protein